MSIVNARVLVFFMRFPTKFFYVFLFRRVKHTSRSSYRVQVSNFPKDIRWTSNIITYFTYVM